MASLDEWNAKFGSDTDYNKPAPRGFTFDMDTQYRCVVRGAKVTRSKLGDVQLELDTEIMRGDSDEVAGTNRLWLALPKQDSDVRLPVEKVRMVTFRRRDDIAKLLGSLDADIYGIDDALEGPERVEREMQVNAKVLAWCDNLHEAFEADGEIPVDDLMSGNAPVEVYMTKAPNKKKPEYPYTNYQATRDDRYPLFE